jgi:recombinational DNA repair ATPase RecF
VRKSCLVICRQQVKKTFLDWVCIGIAKDQLEYVEEWTKDEKETRNVFLAVVASWVECCEKSMSRVEASTAQHRCNMRPMQVRVR